MRIVWDEEKNEINKRLHKMSFETAQYIFSDDERLERLDRSEGNIYGEERWQSIGKVDDILFVAYNERGDEIRLITARFANKAERRTYNGYYRINGKGWTKAL